MTTATDEYRHEIGNDINWSESYYFTFSDLANDIAGFFRIGLEPNKQQSNMWCSLMHKGRVVYQRFRLNLPYAAAGLEDVRVGDLHFQMEEALQRFRIGFSELDLSLDLLWAGFHPVFDLHEAMGEMSGSVANGHYEQSGIVTGSVHFNGQTIPVNGTGFRDHSWGARNWEGVKNWKTCVGQFGTHFAFGSAEINEFNGDQSYLGLIYDAGEIILVNKVKVDIDDISKPKSGLVTLEKANGDSTKVDIEFLQVCHMPYDSNELLECYVKLHKDGETCGGIAEINRNLRAD